MSTMPPISLRSDRRSVDTSPWGGSQKDPHNEGLLGKDHQQDSSAANSETIRRRIGERDTVVRA